MYTRNKVSNISLDNVLIIDVKKPVNIKDELIILATHYGINIDCDFIVQNVYNNGDIKRRYIMSDQNLDTAYPIKVLKQSNFHMENIILANELKLKENSSEPRKGINYLTLISKGETYIIHKSGYKLIKDRYPEINESYSELVNEVKLILDEESQSKLVDVWNI